MEKLFRTSRHHCKCFHAILKLDIGMEMCLWIAIFTSKIVRPPPSPYLYIVKTRSLTVISTRNITVLVKSFAHLMLWIFCDTPWERGANFEHGWVWNDLFYKLSTTSKVYLSSLGRLEKKFYLNVRNFCLRLYKNPTRWSSPNKEKCAECMTTFINIPLMMERKRFIFSPIW